MLVPICRPMPTTALHQLRVQLSTGPLPSADPSPANFRFRWLRFWRSEVGNNLIDWISTKRPSTSRGETVKQCRDASAEVVSSAETHQRLSDTMRTKIAHRIYMLQENSSPSGCCMRAKNVQLRFNSGSLLLSWVEIWVDLTFTSMNAGLRTQYRLVSLLLVRPEF